MSRLDKLIAELCPDGVEYKKLGELFLTRNGYTPSKNNATYWTNGTVPWFRMEDIRENGHILSDSIQHVTKEAVKGELFPANSLIVATSATIGEHALVTVPSLANQRFTFLMLKDVWKSQFSIKFLYYYCYKLDKWCLDHLNQGNFASVDMKQFVSFRFPIPPLPVQQEIVRILDQFTKHTAELKAELTAELTARKKQYEYYRDSLLFSNKGFDMKTILEVADTFTGLTYKPSDTAPEGTLVLRSSNIKDARLCFDNNVFVQMSSIPARAIAHENDILVCVRNGSRSLIGKAAIIPKTEKPMAFGAFMTVLRAKPNIINYRYLFHVWQSPRIQSVMHGDDAMPINQITSRELSKVKIPVPSLEIQNIIVGFLDRFENLSYDLVSGLPTEIAARQKQYEYYRDKLLTFKEKKTQ